MVVQRYRRRQDAEHRLRVKRALWSQIQRLRRLQSAYGDGLGGVGCLAGEWSRSCLTLII